MRSLTTESFDRFGRYSHIWSVRSTLPDRPLRILDVGDPYGILGRLFDRDFTVSIDFLSDPQTWLGPHAHLVGSGLSLPFADGSFDLVATHDALEHVPATLREPFLRELLRVSAGPVIVVAPFADDRTQRCEEIVNGYYTARFGSSLDQLDEHRAAILPEVEWFRSWALTEGVAAEVYGDGWLFNWLAFMLVKGHLVSEQFGATDRAIDTAYNLHLRDVDRRAPHYRRVAVLRPPEGWTPPDGEPDHGDAIADERRLMQLGIQLAEVLPKGHDPASRGSALRDWIERRVAGDDEIAEVARSLRTALDAATQEGPVAGAEAAPARETPDGELPSISVVIVNLNGADHLRTCLASLADLRYPRDRLEVIVVDNGSNDGSLELLEEQASWVRTLPQDANLGFAPAVNIGARASTAQCLVLLNNDMRVEPEFLVELARLYDPAKASTCVAAEILSWDGEHVDFGGGTVNFYGMGAQIGYGIPVPALHPVDGEEILFACGGAMLIDREVFLDVGGFDDDYFAYFEDVDLGWRLRLYGHRVRLAPRARCFHRMHGTSSRFAFHQRLHLYERNALRTIIKNYEARNLPKALAAALLLAAKRGVIAGELDPEPFRIGGDGASHEDVARVALASVHAVSAVLDDLDGLLERRREIQGRRVVRDHELAVHFGYPFLPTAAAADYVTAQDRLIELFGLDRLFTEERGSSVLVVTGEVVAEKMRGPAIRALEIAKALTGVAKATLAVPQLPAVVPDGVELAVYRDGDELLDLAAEADVVIIQGYLLRRHPTLRSIDGLLVADLYDPWLFEVLEVHRGLAADDAPSAGEVSVLSELLEVADFFICASERQRDYWMGMLTSAGRLDQSTYDWDPTLRKVIDVVPFGLPDRPPHRTHAVLKGVHPAVAEDDLVVLWGGGTWDWFDPLTAIRAFATVARLIPRAKLYFLGLQLKDDNVADMRMAQEAVALAEELGLAGTSVIFGDWAPYEEREAYLLESDVALSVARNVAETRLAYRSRLLDAFWSGLPVITTEGDALADIVREHGAGTVVPPGDEWPLAHALVRMLGNDVFRAQCAARSLALSEDYSWQRCVEPLRKILRRPSELQETRWRRPRRSTTTTRFLVRQMRKRLQEVDVWQESAENAERLYRQQEERAELHLGEVRELLDRAAAHEEERRELAARIDALEAEVREREQEIDRIRLHPGYRAARRVRDTAKRLAPGSD